jgi:hypothetical protein
MKLLDIINEQGVNDPITDKERKKIKAVYIALKVGVISVDDVNPYKIKYVLQNEYDIERGPRTGRAIIVLLGDASDVCKLYKVNNDGSTGEYIPTQNNETLYVFASKRIEKKFNRFDLHIIY